jgi:O-antigen/teichoic acid export membrane protein
MKYPSDTKTVVYLAGITLIFYSITITFNSLFQGFEKMQYMFYYQFISGLILTIFSVLILFFGCRLLGLTLVYYFGSFLGLIISIYFVTKIIPSMAIKIDTIFWKESFLKGMPFFIPALLAMVGSKFGVILLSKLAGDASVGVYGAALVIVDRLTVIPDGICTALFPTIASVYQRSKEDAISLFQKVFLYLVLLGLPMAVGTTLLASPIIKLIYGSKYQDSSLVLQILIWWLFMVFVNAIQSSTLSAIHREKKVAILPFISMPIYIFMNFLLIPKYGANGTAVSSIIASLVSSVVVYKITKKYFTSKLIEFKILLKILLANLIMAVTIMFLASLNLFFTITAGVLSYAIAVFMLKVIDWADVKKMTNLVTKKQIILDNNPE